MFSCFLDVRKAFDTVWIDGLLYKLFNDLGINGKMWLAIKDLYTDVQAQVLYDGTLSRHFEIVQGTGQGRILALFMYKVYINGLLRTLSDHCLAISINTLTLSGPGGGGLRGPDDQTHSSQSETSYSMTLKLGDF